jgi:glutathione synthase/RimK-type ligase-like ATP-grasp enzyme
MNALPSGEPADANAAALKILVIAAQNMPLAARISMALADAGFRVATLTPLGNPVRRLRKIRDHFGYRPGSRWKSAIRAIEQWSPDFLVCTDDLAVRELQVLHRRLSISGDATRRHISDLIELSLGSAASFETTRNKSDFLTRVETEGLRCPATIVVPAARPFASVPAELTYPVIVKADQSYGGTCVRTAGSDAAVRAAVWELQTPGTWRRMFRRLFGAILGSEALAPLMLPLRRTVSLQQYIAGRPCNRAVVCWKGAVLAGISAEAVEVLKEHGPASVVRLIDHPEMATICEHMVKCLNLSGFVGFDFILDSSDRAWVIEMNPRVTPICHLALADGTNLPASLCQHMNGPPPLPAPAPASADPDVIALFPSEIIRSPASEHIRSSRHDVPWSEPQLVRYVLDQALRRGITKRVRTFVERYLPHAARKGSC